MKHRFVSIALSAAVVLLAGNPSRAADAAKGSKPAASQPGAKAQPTPAKPVDINSASRAELKTLPGIGDDDAARIIAARPYPSKAKLVVDKVLSDEAYLALKGRIVAVQKDPAPKRKP